MESQIEQEVAKVEQWLDRIEKASEKPSKALLLWKQMGEVLDELDRKYDEAEFQENFGKLVDARMLPILVSYTDQTHGLRTRKTAIDEIGYFHDDDDSLKRLLLGLLGDKNPKIRAASASALGSFKGFGEEEVRLLLSLLSDPVDKVREAAWISISWIAGEDKIVREEVLSLLQNPLSIPRKALWFALMTADDVCPELKGKEKKTWIDALLNILMVLPDNRSWACWKAGDTLGEHIGGKAGLVPLLEALKSPYVSGRRSAIHGLDHVGDRAAIPYLEEAAAHDRSKNVRDGAKALAEYLSGDMEGYPPHRY